MKSSNAHYTLMSISPAYKEFYLSRMYQSYDDNGDLGVNLKRFARWLVTGSSVERFATWTKEQFDNQMDFYSSWEF